MITPFSRNVLYHLLTLSQNDIKLLDNVINKNGYIAYYLKEIACDIPSLESEHHEQDIRLISESESDDIAKSIVNAVRNKNSLNYSHYISNYDRVMDMYNRVLMYSNNDTTKDLPSSIFCKVKQ